MNKEHYEKLTEDSGAEWNEYVKECRKKDSDWRADLSGADLEKADLSFIELIGVNLSGADLERANLISADLSGAYLRFAYLRGATLVGAFLVGADLKGADLIGADLSNTNLSRADLSGANLVEADLKGAKLQEARYSISQMLVANWGVCSDETTLQLMRLDAEALPNGYTLMDTWAREEKGLCPFDNLGIRRVANFKERREVWKRGRSKTLWEIWKMLAEEKGILGVVV